MVTIEIKKFKKVKKGLAILVKLMYTINCCDMIAKKREVAVKE